MLPIRIKACSESDLRMLGNLARNIQRVLPVTQADIDAAAALGEGWVVWKVIEVNDPINNLRGGTQLVIKQNSITPGQNVRRVLIVQGPSGETVIIGPGPSPLLLPDAVANSLSYVKAFGGTEQRNLPDGYTELEYIESTGTQWIALPLAFDATDEIYARFSVNTNQTSDKYIVAPTTWNTANNRFGLGVTDTGYTMAFGAIQTSSTALSPTIRNDGNLHTWSYKNRICTVEDLNTSLDTTNIMFGATTNNLKLFFGYNSVTSGKVAYYRHKKANGTAVDLIPAKRNSDNVVGMYDTVSGTFFTNAGTGTFIAGPTAVPTPDAPIDIVSNNGVLKVSSQLLTNGNCANNTDNWALGSVFYDNTDDYIAFTNNSSSLAYIRCNTNNSRIANHTYAYLITGKTETGTMNWGSRNASTAGVQLQTTERTLGFIDTFPENGSGEPWINMPAGTTFVLNKKSGFRMFDLTALGLDAVITTPKQAIDYFGTIYREPKEIYTDGTVETINVHGKNLYDSATMFSATSMAVEGGIIYWGYATGGKAIKVPCKPNTTYTLSYTGGNRCFIGGFTNDVPLEPDSRIVCDFVIYNGASSAVSPKTFTTPANCYYVCCGLANSSGGEVTDIQLEQGSTATEYEPYYNGGSLECPMLLSANIYTDEQEIISGQVTRNLDVRVFDGTENWTQMTNNRGFFYGVSSDDACRAGVPLQQQKMYCTHFNFVVWANNATPMAVNSIGYNMTAATQLTNGNITIRPDTSVYNTVEKWKAFLAEQYANGTPVIVVRIAEPTTEVVAGQTLQVQAGDNTLEITQASLSGLELEAKYTKIA